MYSEACAPGEPTPCDAQYLKLNMMFTASSVVFNLVALPTGFILDKAGPRVTMVLACAVCVLGMWWGSLSVSVLFTYADLPEREGTRCLIITRPSKVFS